MADPIEGALIGFCLTFLVGLVSHWGKWRIALGLGVASGALMGGLIAWFGWGHGPAKFVMAVHMPIFLLISFYVRLACERRMGKHHRTG